MTSKPLIVNHSVSGALFNNIEDQWDYETTIMSIVKLILNRYWDGYWDWYSTSFNNSPKTGWMLKCYSMWHMFRFRGTRHLSACTAMTAQVQGYQGVYKDTRDLGILSHLVRIIAHLRSLHVRTFPLSLFRTWPHLSSCPYIIIVFTQSPSPVFQLSFGKDGAPSIHRPWIH